MRRLGPAVAASLAFAAPAHAAGPPAGAAEVAAGAGHLVWLDTVAGRRVLLDRAGGRTVALDVDPRLHDLDVGSDARRQAVAVYVRCRPTCDVFALDLVHRRERRVASVSAKGVSEHQPTVAAGRVAVRRGNRVLIGPLRGGGRARVLLRTDTIELELGGKQLAYTRLAATDVGNGAMDLTVLGLRSHRRDRIRRRYIGEGDSTGIGALRFAGPAIFWQERHRSGCTVGAPQFLRFDLRRHRLVRPTASTVPADVRAPRVPAPETPESEGCGES